MSPLAINLIVGIGGILLAYLLGSIPTGVIIGRVFFKKDPRDYYSHNMGGTNTGRVLGKKIGVLTIILDMIKTIIPVYVVWAIVTFNPDVKSALQWNESYNAGPLFYWGAGLFCAIGHCWPIYLGFKGGKAVSCFMGMNALTSWIEFIMAGFMFLGVKKVSKYVSLSSMCAAISGAVTAWIIFIIQVSTGWDAQLLTFGFGLCPWPAFGWEFAIVDTFIAVLLIIRHKQNIVRLKNGTEHKSPL